MKISNLIIAASCWGAVSGEVVNIGAEVDNGVDFVIIMDVDRLAKLPHWKPSLSSKFPVNFEQIKNAVFSSKEFKELGFSKDSIVGVSFEKNLTINREIHWRCVVCLEEKKINSGLPLLISVLTDGKVLRKIPKKDWVRGKWE